MHGRTIVRTIGHSVSHHQGTPGGATSSSALTDPVTLVTPTLSIAAPTLSHDGQLSGDTDDDDDTHDRNT
jgi:hypothetical protein